MEQSIKIIRQLYYIVLILTPLTLVLIWLDNPWLKLLGIVILGIQWGCIIAQRLILRSIK